MSFTFILLTMFFMHVLDDYVLQAPALCNLKQKNFWEKNAPEKPYRFDYIVALIMHAISWSFMIMLPCAFALSFNIGLGFALCFILNTAVHATVDPLKANVRVINLWVDQTIHLIQIMITFMVFYFGVFVC